MCILKVIDFWGCLYMLTLGLKLYYDFLLISSSRAMKIESNSILVCCKHALSSFSEAKGWNDRRIIRLDNYWRKGWVCLICCLRVGKAETDEIYVKCNEFLYLRACQESKCSNIFLIEHFSTGKVLWFENITFYGNILLSAILLMQHGTLSMSDLASFLSQQLPRRLVRLCDFGGFQGSITLIPDQHS